MALATCQPQGLGRGWQCSCRSRIGKVKLSKPPIYTHPTALGIHWNVITVNSVIADMLADRIAKSSATHRYIEIVGKDTTTDQFDVFTNYIRNLTILSPHHVSVSFDEKRMRTTFRLGFRQIVYASNSRELSLLVPMIDKIYRTWAITNGHRPKPVHIAQNWQQLLAILRIEDQVS